MKRSIIFFSLLFIINGLLACERGPVVMSESFPFPTKPLIPSIFLTKDFKSNLSETYHLIKVLKFANPTISNSEIGTAFISKISTAKISADVLSPSFRSEVESQLNDDEAIVRDIHDTYTTDDIAYQQAFGLTCAFSTILKRK